MVSRFEQFASSIAAVYHYIQKIERAEMANFGMKGPHAQYLIAMVRYPQGITAAQLGKICDKDKAAVSRAVTELEQEGLIRRLDARTYRTPLVLTQKGAAAAAMVNKKASRAVEAAGQGLSDENRVIFYEALNLIASNLHRIAAEGLASSGEEQS